MEKINNMQRNQIADDELEQVSGGRKLWDLLTMEFFEFLGQPGMKAKTLEAEDTNARINTLEMRVRADRNLDDAEAPMVVTI